MAAPSLSRRRSPHAEKVEVRVDVELEIADVLDAVSLSRRMPRNELVIEILEQWKDGRIHESTLVQRVMRREGRSGESTGQARE